MKEDHFKSDIFEDETPVDIGKKAKFPALIYLGLAILVVVIATVGIFSISYDSIENLPDPVIEDISISLPDISEPAIKPEFPVINEQSGVDAEVSEEEKPTYFSPVSGEIIKGYSMEALVFSATMKDYRVHSGIDIAAEKGSKVVAFTDGVVESVTDDWFYGTTVAIKHSMGLTSYYMGLDPEVADGIAAGAAVAAGEAIGAVGSCRIEAEDAPHLHFELRVDGNLIDPSDELPS